MAVGFEFVGAVKVMLKVQGGAYVDLGRTSAEERCALALRQHDYQARTDEGGGVPLEVVNLGAQGILTFTLVSFDMPVFETLIGALPRTTALTGGSIRQGVVGRLWTTTTQAGAGFFGIKLTPILGTGRIERIIPRCFFSGEWFRDSEFGNAETRKACIIEVLPDPTTGELYTEIAL